MNKVYIELIFLDNFIINGLIILFASVLTKTPKKWGRFVCAAAMGGIYACVSAVLDASSFPVKTAVGLLMCVVAFYVRGGKNLIKNICAFYVTTFVFAGAVYAAVLSSGAAVTPLFRCILIGIAIGVVLIAVLSRIRQRARLRVQHTIDLVFSHQGRQTAVRAYADTGNLLTEPIRGVGVVFVTKAVAQKIFDSETMALLCGKGGVTTERLRIIAGSTASGRGIFYGIEIDKLSAKGAADGTSAVVCIANTTLTDGCGAIVGPPIMDKLLKGEQHENTLHTKDDRMAANSPEDGGRDLLHQRQRSASTAPHTTGGNNPSATAG